MRSKLGPGALRIAYCGPVAQPGQPARGGYESANRRLIDDLRLRGVDVLELPYPLARGMSFVKAAAYARGFADIAREMVQQRRRYDIFHLTPLYRQFLYGEALLCALARRLGKRVVFDIRAGSFIRHYENRSSVYRALADSLMGSADLLAVEGQEGIPFAQARHAKSILYLPNYHTPLGTESDANSAREDTLIRLIFLGRIVPEKGIETAIATVAALQVMGFSAHLDVVGSGDADYVSALKTGAAHLPVSWNGPLAADSVRARLAAAHFFVFPTRHPGEGHSNALTEAMAEGAVPVCAENGFNRSVAAETGRVLPVDATAGGYAETIAGIWQSGTWQALSDAARARIATHYTSDVVVESLIRRYADAATSSLEN